MLTKIYHKKHGETSMYQIDATAAVSNFPQEWSNTPWEDGVDAVNATKAEADAKADADAKAAADAKAKVDAAKGTFKG